MWPKCGRLGYGTVAFHGARGCCEDLKGRISAKKRKEMKAGRALFDDFPRPTPSDWPEEGGFGYFATEFATWA